MILPVLSDTQKEEREGRQQPFCIDEQCKQIVVDYHEASLKRINLRRIHTRHSISYRCTIISEMLSSRMRMKNTPVYDICFSSATWRS